MFLTNKQVEERLSSPRNLASRIAEFRGEVSSPQVEVITETREIRENKIDSIFNNQITEITMPSVGKNKINLDKNTRTEIAIRSRTGEHQPKLAQEFGITQANVSSIERGKTKGIDEEHANKVISQVKDRALDRLMCSLGLLDDDKLSSCSAKDLSIIASNMGRVVDKISPKEERPDNINFIIYAPELKQEKSFQTVEV